MEKNKSPLVSTCHEHSTEGQCYFPGRQFTWLPWANEAYSNYWSYYCGSQMKLQKYLYLCLPLQHTVFSSPKLLKKAQMKTEGMSQASCCWSLSPGGWVGSIWNAGSGRTVTCQEVLAEAAAWPQTRSMTERWAQVWPHAPKCKEEGVGDHDQLLLSWNSCGKRCTCSLS